MQLRKLEHYPVSTQDSSDMIRKNHFMVSLFISHDHCEKLMKILFFSSIRTLLLFNTIKIYKIRYKIWFSEK